MTSEETEAIDNIPEVYGVISDGLIVAKESSPHYISKYKSVIGSKKIVCVTNLKNTRKKQDKISPKISGGNQMDWKSSAQKGPDSRILSILWST